MNEPHATPPDDDPISREALQTAKDLLERTELSNSERFFAAMNALVYSFVKTALAQKESDDAAR